MRQSSTRPHLVSETKNLVQKLSDFSHKGLSKIKTRVTHLLEKNHFMCYLSLQHVSKLRLSLRGQCKAYLNRNVGWRIATPKIAKLLFHNWYRGSRMRESTHKPFLNYTNNVLIYLTRACIHHALKAWSSGSFVQS